MLRGGGVGPRGGGHGNQSGGHVRGNQSGRRKAAEFFIQICPCESDFKRCKIAGNKWWKILIKEGWNLTKTIKWPPWDRSAPGARAAEADGARWCPASRPRPPRLPRRLRAEGWSWSRGGSGSPGLPGVGRGRESADGWGGSEAAASPSSPPRSRSNTAAGLSALAAVFGILCNLMKGERWLC